MRNAARVLGLGSLFLGFFVSGARSQTLEESCPDLGEGLGGLIGYVVDSDSEMIMPGASVSATWADGESAVDTGLDGVYRLCDLPVGVALVLQANFATFAGEPVEHQMNGDFERLDFGISMLAAAAAAASGGRDDRILISLPDGRCPVTLQFPGLICGEGWRLERCEYVDKGRIVARRSGGGTDDKELVERFVIEAQRAGADAILNLKGDLRAPSGAGNMVLYGLEGLGIQLVDPSCRG